MTLRPTAKHAGRGRWVRDVGEQRGAVDAAVDHILQQGDLAASYARSFDEGERESSARLHTAVNGTFVL